MGKTITISDEAYKRLKKRKKAGQSFTDMINEAFPFPLEKGKDFFKLFWGDIPTPKKGVQRARKAR